MAGIPVYCRHCGAIFQSLGFGLAPGVRGMTLIGNTETCINCGQMANIIDGVFEVSVDDVLSLAAGPPLSKVLLERFSELVGRAAKNQIAPDDLQREAAKIDPKLGLLVASVQGKHLGIAALVILVMFLSHCNFEVKLDLNQLLDQWTHHGTKQVYVPSTDSNVKHAKDRKSASDSKPSSKSPHQK